MSFKLEAYHCFLLSVKYAILSSNKQKKYAFQSTIIAKLLIISSNSGCFYMNFCHSSILSKAQIAGSFCVNIKR